MDAATPTEKKKLAGFTDLPQELVDQAVEPLLPTTLQVRVYEYEVAWDPANPKDTDIVVQPSKSWKWAAQLRGTTPKLKEAVDTKFDAMDTLELRLTDPNKTKKMSNEKIWGLENTMDQDSFKDIIEKHAIKTVTTTATFEWEYSIFKTEPDSSAAITLSLSDDKWTVSSIDWTRTYAIEDEYIRIHDRRFCNLIRGIVVWLMELWSKEGLSADGLAKLQQCLTMDPEELGKEDWVLKAEGLEMESKRMGADKMCRGIWMPLGRDGRRDERVLREAGIPTVCMMVLR